MKEEYIPDIRDLIVNVICGANALALIFRNFILVSLNLLKEELIELVIIFNGWDLKNTPVFLN